MKLAAKILSLLVLVGMATLYIGCKNNDGPTETVTDKQIKALVATWKVAADTDVTLDGDPPQLGQKDLTIVIQGNAGSTQVNYTITKRPIGPSAWNTGGTFEFNAASPTTKVKREDNVEVLYEVDGSKLKMTFTVSGSGYTSTSGRTASVAGVWVYNFTKQ
jgi:hypothetical protein